MSETTVRTWHQPSDAQSGMITGWLYKLLVLDFVLYAIRDTLTGSIRFYMDLFHLSSLWFVPDLLAFGIMALFVRQAIFINRSLPALIFMLSFVAAAVIGVIYMNQSRLAFMTAVKAVVPIFVGMAFMGRSATEMRYARIILFTMMSMSVIGLIFAPYADYPWVGAEINNFGFAKTVGKLWWDGGVIRYGGFAGDSTMAAFMVVFPYVMLHRYLPHWANFLLWPVLWHALDVSTSKTASGVMGVFIAYYLFINFIVPSARRHGVNIYTASLSYILVLAPIGLILLFSGARLDASNPGLFSLQDRIDNSWQLPFTYLTETYPLGLVTGCGLGCFSYPMTYTEMANYWVPVDNFYITTYLFMGIPFLIMLVGQMFSIRHIKDDTKLILIFLLNIYTITVACYGPSFATILAGYMFSDLFLKRDHRWTRTKTASDPSGGDTQSVPMTRRFTRPARSAILNINRS